MKVSLLGPTNIEKFSKIIGRSFEEIEEISKNIGEILAKNKCSLLALFSYAGVEKFVGDSYKANGGKLEMLYTENDYDWYTEMYKKDLDHADIKTKKDSWHDLLLSFVKDSDYVVCAGLSAGVFVELGYMKWNYQEKKGKVKALIVIKEFLKNGELPPEISYDLGDLIIKCSIDDLEETIKNLNKLRL